MNNDSVFFEQYLQFYTEYKKTGKLPEKQVEKPFSELTEADLLAKAKAEYDRLKKELDTALAADRSYIHPEAEDASVYFSLRNDDRINSVFQALCQYVGGKSDHWSAMQLSDFLQDDLHRGRMPYSFGGFEPACVTLAMAATFGKINVVNIEFLHGKWEERGDYAYDSHVTIRCVKQTAQVFTESPAGNVNETAKAKAANTKEKAAAAFAVDFAQRNLDRWMERYGDSLSAHPQITIIGKTFAFAGFGRENEENHCVVKAVIEKGGVYHASVSDTTDYLIVNPRNAETAKMQNAVAEKENGNGVQIILIGDLMDCLIDVFAKKAPVKTKKN